MKFLRLRYVYMLALWLASFAYFFPKIFRVEAEVAWLQVYFGNLIYFMFAILLLYGLGFWIEDKLGKIAYELRIYLFILCFFSALCLFLFRQVGLDASLLDLGESEQHRVLNLSVYEYKLGLIASFFIYRLMNIRAYPFSCLYYALLVCLCLTSFLLVYKPVKKRIANYIRRKRERKKREAEERLIREQMAIKKALEQEEYRKRQKFEQRRTELIQERARSFEMGRLVNSVSFFEDEEEKEEELERAKEKPSVVGQKASPSQEEDFSLEIHAEQLD